MKNESNPLGGLGRDTDETIYNQPIGWTTQKNEIQNEAVNACFITYVVGTEGNSPLIPFLNHKILVKFFYKYNNKLVYLRIFGLHPIILHSIVLIVWIKPQIQWKTLSEV